MADITPGESKGKPKIVMRTANHDKTALTTDPPRPYSSVSTDGGQTWSEARPKPDLHNAKSKGYFGRSADGRHVHVCNDGTAQCDKIPGFPSCGRTSLREMIKPPGSDWSGK